MQDCSRKTRTSLPFGNRHSAQGACMRIGLMIGPEKGRYAPEGGASSSPTPRPPSAPASRSIWVPQIPDDFDALTAIALMGRATDRVELGTAVLPIQTRHPVAMAQQALVEPGGVRRAVHARARAFAPLDRRRHARAVLRQARPPGAGLPRGAQRRVRRPRPGRRRERQLPRAQPTRRHRHRRRRCSWRLSRR